jgi:hypothetical protein
MDGTLEKDESLSPLPPGFNFENFRFFRIRGWYKGIVSASGIDTARRMENTFRPHRVKRQATGEKVGTNSFNFYRRGERLPSPKVVADVANHFPETGDFFWHPIWDVLVQPVPSLRTFETVLGRLPSETARYYRDLATMSAHDDFIRHILSVMGQEIWVDRGDYWAALDHLAINLLMLRCEASTLYIGKRPAVAANVKKTLGPLSECPWFRQMYPSFFDHLEHLIWTDLFDTYSPDAIDFDLSEELQMAKTNFSAVKGWRLTQPGWLLTEDEEG